MIDSQPEELDYKI